MISKTLYARQQVAKFHSEATGKSYKLYWAAGIPATFSLDFHQQMLNRRMFGHYRHETGKGVGSVGSIIQLDAIKLLKVKLKKYEKTGNGELLADIANYCEIEFQRPKHPKYHYRQEDSGDSDRYKR